jgi:hypothetical protein
MAGKQQYTQAQIIAALTKCHGMVYLAAKELGCVHQTIRNYMQRYPAVRQAAEQQRGEMVDLAELKLWESVKKGEQWGVTLCLKTIGKDRGYVERHEQTGADGGPNRLMLEGTAHLYVESAREKVRKRLAEIAARRTPGLRNVPVNGHSQPPDEHSSN